MSNSIESSISKQQSSTYSIGNGASFAVDDGLVKNNNTIPRASPDDLLAICRVQGSDQNLYYFNTSFSGGPEWRF
ncbi:hypothetical protein DL93DRAFT_2173045 [Clavulina sp. PMI_390]|nr:hypothetical protein DL93DRAFT_2173045 [Clavulina sp. PMI_390]